MSQIQKEESENQPPNSDKTHGQYRGRSNWQRGRNRMYNNRTDWSRNLQPDRAASHLEQSNSHASEINFVRPPPSRSRHRNNYQRRHLDIQSRSYHDNSGENSRQRASDNQDTSRNEVPKFRGRQPGLRYRRDHGTRQAQEQDGPSDSHVSEKPSPTEIAQCDIAKSQLKDDTFECMICCDNIRTVNPIWSCSKCYNIFHLRCSIEWCNKSIKSRNEAHNASQFPQLNDVTGNSEDVGSSNSGSNRNQDRQRIKPIEWPCPACRETLYSRPGKYKCFCGKVTNPEAFRHLIPHSCGRLCGRKRPNSNCPHPCNSLCHPGRCTPCSLTSRKACFCGKRVREEKCSQPVSSCDEVCGRDLTCGNHQCELTCHPGACNTCTKVLNLECFCGRHRKEKLCKNLGISTTDGNLRYSCNELCGKVLDCGNHRCQSICHPGDCTGCRFLNENVKSCPCGSTRLERSILSTRKSCLDPLPTCSNKCNRNLFCGPLKNRHKCQKKCHVGECPQCRLKTSIQCGCGSSSKIVECSSLSITDMLENSNVNTSFYCEARCNKLKNCGRHRCNNKCCRFLENPELHRCEQICNRKLACGLHSCSEPCHPGQCGDCANIGWEELSCHCGSSILYPPVPCGAHRPSCNRPCRRPHDCDHPVKHECHDDSEKCPPCTMFVLRSCFCGAESKENVYCYQPGYSCGRTCKKKLPCGVHSCERVCHVGSCQAETVTCTQPCPMIRSNCKHPCSQACHGQSLCPRTECKKSVEVTCKCGNKVERNVCYKVTNDVDNRSKVTMMNLQRSDPDSVLIDLTKNTSLSSRSDNDNLKRLECDDTCQILERNKALAEALDIVQPDLKPTNVFGEDPLKLIREATIQDYKFVSATFNSLSKFVKLAKESEKRFIFMQFPPCDRLKREIIHELAHHFHCTSESRNEEPFKQVIVRAYKNKSCVPDFTIEQLLPVTD